MGGIVCIYTNWCEPDVALDVAPDVVPEVAPDVAPEVAPDVAPDVATDVAPEPWWYIEIVGRCPYRLMTRFV